MHIIPCSGHDTIRSNANDRQYHPRDYIFTDALKDKAGNLWFATSRGVYRYDGKSFVNFTEEDGLNSDKISCIYEDKTGTLWFGTNNGACQYDGKRFINFPFPAADSSNAKYLPSDRFPKQVTDILQDKTGNFWFTTIDHGLYRYDGKSFTVFLPGKTLQCLAEDKTGGILVGSWSGEGVYRYDGKSFTRFDGSSDGMNFCMLKDRTGNIWIGTREYGADRYDGNSVTNFSAKDGLNNNVSCIYEDSKGNLWFGSDVTGRGTQRGDAFRYDGKSFTNVTAREGLTMNYFEYNVRSIVEDNAGNIWLGSRNGVLLRYDGTSFTDFSEKVLRP